MVRSRRRILAYACTVGLLSAAGCDSVVDPPRMPVATPRLHVEKPVPPRPQPPKFVTRTPVYPAPVIYILYREYLHRNPGLTSLSAEDPKYQRYLERRLRQLYPTKGYEGMMIDAVEEIRQDRMAWVAYQRELRDWKNAVGVMACTGTSVIDPDTGESCFPPVDPEPETSSDPMLDSSWEGQVEHAVPDDSFIPTLQMEIDTLQMDQTEINQLYYQESLADGSYYSRYGEVIVATGGARATIDDLIRAAGEGRTVSRGNATIQVNPVIIATIVSHSLLIGWKAWRAYVAAGRAEKKPDEFYPGMSASDTRKDAYRHIYWNMQMGVNATSSGRRRSVTFTSNTAVTRTRRTRWITTTMRSGTT